MTTQGAASSKENAAEDHPTGEGQDSKSRKPM
jgi:hypothetical protein